MSHFKGFGTMQNGSMWNGPYGFLYKKYGGGGGRRNPSYGLICNRPTYLYNKYKPGSGGVGASSVATRRAKNRRATVCQGNTCFPCYMTLGQYSNYTHNPNGFIPCYTPLPPPVGYLYSKNNTTDGGFTVGGEINKDMNDQDYDERIDPQEYYPQFFPDMAPFTDENIVAGDKVSGDRLLASYWEDWGNDIFDVWGYFYLYDVASGKYYFPLIDPQNEDDGVITTQTFNAFGRTFTINQGYPVQGIFKFDISVNDSAPFRFGAYGKMGSDGNEVIEYLTYPYTLSSTNLTLHYMKHQEVGDNIGILYSYFIPKNVSQNSSKTYVYNVALSNDSLISNEITNGLLVYFSKTNDVKEWVVNDLGL
jgi:hypothetical protein